MKRHVCWFGSLLLCILSFAGCAPSGMKSVERTGFLSNYDQLQPGGEGRAAMVYIKPGVNLNQYDKLMFERIVLLLADSAETRAIDPAMLKELTDYYQNAIFNAVKDGYQVVDQPGPGVLRVRVAITGIKPAKPMANTLSSITPVGWVVSGATKLASYQNVGTGEAATEFELLDAQTGERLAAAMDQRQGGKTAFGGKWDDTRDAFDTWAKRFRQRLDEARGVR